MSEFSTSKPTSNLTVAQQMAIVEALLFVTGEPVPLVNLQRALDIDADWLQELLVTLNTEYEEQERGLRIHQHGSVCQLVTSPAVAVYVERYLGLQNSAKLSAAALETLTIVAYRQPITRSAIEGIRGVDSSGVLNTLQGRGLIEEVGRSESIGHPVLYGTTIDFLNFFGLTSLSQLPPLQGLLPPEPPANPIDDSTSLPTV